MIVGVSNGVPRSVAVVLYVFVAFLTAVTLLSVGGVL